MYTTVNVITIVFLTIVTYIALGGAVYAFISLLVWIVRGYLDDLEEEKAEAALAASALVEAETAAAILRQRFLQPCTPCLDEDRELVWIIRRAAMRFSYNQKISLLNKEISNEWDKWILT